MKKIILKIGEKDFDKTGRNYSLERDINKRLDEGLSSSKGVLIRDIQKMIAPIIRGCDVFISYSHRDNKIAKFVAKALNEAGFKVFIDALFWGSIDKALRNYDDKEKGDDKYYDYEKRNKSTSTFHMILADSLIDTIRNCRAFLFLEGEETIDSATVSPWLYLENKIANERKNDLPLGRKIHESAVSNIYFPMQNDDFYTASSLNEVIRLLGS